MINLLRQLWRIGRGRQHGEAMRAIAFLACLLAYATTGYMYFELPVNPSLHWLDAFWWSVVTMTTVGYGDLFPTTAAGRIVVGFPTMLMGVAVLGYVLSLIASKLLENKLKEIRGMKTVDDADHLIICNYTNLDSTLELLSEIRRDPSTADASVVLIDPDLEELPAQLRDSVRFVRGEPARPETLAQANLDEAKAVIIRAKLSDDDAADNYSLRIGLTVESIRPTVHTIVECRNPANVSFFERASCDSVVCLASLSDRMLIQELQDPGIADVVAELASNQHGKQFYLVPCDKVGIPFSALQQQHLAAGTVVLGLRRQGKNHLLPDGNMTVEAQDLAIAVAPARPSC